MGLSGKSFEIGTQMVYAFSVIMVIRLDNWMHNDTIRSAGDSVFGTVIELSFMFAMVLPLLYVSAFVWKLDFIWLFIIRYIDEPIRIVIMYIHLFSGKWMRPVTPEGKAALPAFFEELGHSASKK